MQSSGRRASQLSFEVRFFIGLLPDFVGDQLQRYPCFARSCHDFFWRRKLLMDGDQGKLQQKESESERETTRVSPWKTCLPRDSDFLSIQCNLGTLGKSLAPSQSLGRGGGSFSKPLVTCCCHFQQIPQQFASTQLQRIGDMKCSRLVVVLGAMFIYDASKSYQTLLMASFSLNLFMNPS